MYNDAISQMSGGSIVPDYLCLFDFTGTYELANNNQALYLKSSGSFMLDRPFNAHVFIVGAGAGGQPTSEVPYTRSKSSYANGGNGGEVIYNDNYLISSGYHIVDLGEGKNTYFDTDVAIVGGGAIGGIGVDGLGQNGPSYSISGMSFSFAGSGGAGSSSIVYPGYGGSPGGGNGGYYETNATSGSYYGAGGGGGLWYWNRGKSKHYERYSGAGYQGVVCIVAPGITFQKVTYF